MTDSFAIDNAQLDSLRQAYDYDSQIAKPGKSALELIAEAINNLLSSTLGSKTYADNRTAIWVTVAIVLLVIIAAIVLILKPKIFVGKGKEEKLKHKVTEDNIYGVDFDAEISKATTEKDFPEAVRLTYLKTLRLLADNHLIRWQLSKTPTQYAAEYHTEEFRRMTELFLRVRYGDYPADEDTFSQAQKQAASIAHDINERRQQG